MASKIEEMVAYFGNQTQTARNLNVSQPAVSQWISGASRMSPLIAIRAEKITDGRFKASDLCPALAESVSQDLKPGDTAA